MNRSLSIAIIGTLFAFLFACSKAEVRNSNSPAEVSKKSNGNSDEFGEPLEITREEFDKNKPKFREQAETLNCKVGNGANDLWLWTKIRSELRRSKTLAGSSISVDVENESVNLRGFVSSKSNIEEAEKIARAVEGVKSVRNSLKTSPE